MPNPHSVYMHDTNHKELFSADYRFQSLGLHAGRRPTRSCGLAARGQPGLDRAARSTPRIAKGQRTTSALTHKVPVAWVYLTGWSTRDGVDPLPR